MIFAYFVEEFSSFVLTFICVYAILRCASGLTTHLANTAQHTMWPVQTLTLLLCLTDDEQLFTERAVEPLPPVNIEVVLPCDEERSKEESSVPFPEA